MTRLTDLMDVAVLMGAIADGYVKAQVHPDQDRVIYNYTPKAVFERVWNEATLQSRGLIVDLGGEVIARPFPKFFNLGEHVGHSHAQPQEGSSTLPALPLHEPFRVLDKADGSLGILYRKGSGNLAIATRGSFSSDQAKHATEVLRTRYPDFTPIHGVTYLFEIVYPDNRIVLDYAGLDDLILLDCIDIETGESDVWATASWSGPRIEEYPYDSFEALLAAPPRENKEGYVVHFASGMRVKIKHDEYVRLHAIVTNTSSRTIWELLAAGDGLHDLLDVVPDEFADWAKGVAADLAQQYSAVSREISNDFLRAHGQALADLETADHDNFRKAFAIRAQQSVHKAALFGILDNKNLEPYIWKHIKPERTLPFKTSTEDAA